MSPNPRARRRREPELEARFREAMDDDFNTALAIGHLFEGARTINRLIGEKKFRKKPEKVAAVRDLRRRLLALGGVLGLFGSEPAVWLEEQKLAALPGLGITVEEIEAQISVRLQARREKDFARADRIREELAARGIELLDSPAGHGVEGEDDLVGAGPRACPRSNPPGKTSAGESRIRLGELRTRAITRIAPTSRLRYNDGGAACCAPAYFCTGEIMARFELKSDYQPRGDQPQAIAELTAGVERGDPHQVLLGVTGSGKTFTMANVVAQVQRPTLVLAHNKTLAAQLYGEFKELFPDNAVEYFVSYYDYYQPEAYVPVTDTYIEKDSSINEEIDKLRHSATRSLLSRRDVLIVASVSCIYGLGSPEAYYGMLVRLEEGQELDRNELLRRLVEIQYTPQRRRLPPRHLPGARRHGGDLSRLRGGSGPAHRVLRRRDRGDQPRSTRCAARSSTACRAPPIFPASHYVATRPTLERAIKEIQDELLMRIQYFREQNMLLEAQRIEQRTLFDIEMMEEMGYCQGIENYSRFLDGRQVGQPPATLIDYFPEDALLFIDESHVTVSQIGAMYRGDRSRKETLVNYGFRLPSALDNRPLTFEEFEAKSLQTVYVSATPADYELGKAEGVVVEQIVRPTGLVDPPIEVRPAKEQVDDLIHELRATVRRATGCWSPP